MEAPPVNHVGVDLLVDEPLLSGGLEAEIACLHPDGEMVDLVEFLGAPGVEGVGIAEVAVGRRELDGGVALLAEEGGEEAA